MAKKLFLLVTILVLASLGVQLERAAGASADDDKRKSSDNDRPKYEVTVTNLARRQVLTPTIVIVHNSDFKPLFEEGHSLENTADPAARPEVRPLIEEADAGPLFDTVSNDPNVRQAKILQGTQPETCAPRTPPCPGIIPFPSNRNKVILPGKSASITIDGGGREKLLSLIGMLGQTNDSFYALRGIALPKGNATDTYYSVAYDAGTEVNNELCAFIPGAPCGNACGVNSDAATCARVRALNGEGFVRISEGMHGNPRRDAMGLPILDINGQPIVDLPANMWDWRNPVAKITIRRINSNDD